MGGGVIRDLRSTVHRLGEDFTTIVRTGVLSMGMPAFEGILSDAQIREIQAFVLSQADAR